MSKNLNKGSLVSSAYSVGPQMGPLLIVANMVHAPYGSMLDFVGLLALKWAVFHTASLTMG